MSDDVVMAVRFLGTGAADHQWELLGEDPATRGCTMTSFNRRLLVDAGIAGWETLARFDVDLREVSDLAITHSHRDHFDAGVAGRIAAARAGCGALRIHAAPEILESLRREGGEGRTWLGCELYAGKRFAAGGLAVTALPSNHCTDDVREQTYHFLIEDGCHSVFYALDGAWLTTKERLLIGDRRLDMVIWDATAAAPGDWRSFEHNDLGMIAMMMTALRGTGTVGGDTVSVLTHIARTLWPEGEAAAELAARHGHLLACDGVEIILR